MTNKVFWCGITGQFAWMGSSLGINMMASQAQSIGAETAVFAYSDVQTAYSTIVEKQKAGYKIILPGYSLGAGTAGLLSQEISGIDTVILLDPSRDGINYVVGKSTKRSILLHNNDWLEKVSGIGGAGEQQDQSAVYGPGGVAVAGGDLGCQVKYEFNENHLVIQYDKSVWQIVQEETQKLLG